MKTDINEYHPNGRLKHGIIYYLNDCKRIESFYDQYHRIHREVTPAYQEWYENGMLKRKAYARHGKYHNINNPAYIYFDENRKISHKFYKHDKIKTNSLSKLSWMNGIKNI